MALLITVYLLFRVGWQRALLFLVGFTVLAAPWLIRNEQLFGSPLLATESGETFLGSTEPYVAKATGVARHVGVTDPNPRIQEGNRV